MNSEREKCFCFLRIKQVAALNSNLSLPYHILRNQQNLYEKLKDRK